MSDSATTSSSPAGARAKPLVTVVMPTYNCGPYIAEAIDSALAQDYRPLEIIVADDGSTDNTAAVLARYEGQVRIIRGDHRGVGAARNKILAVAQGEFIAPLDADDIWLPGKISAQVQTLIEMPKVSFCHSGAEMFGSDTGDGPITEERRRRITGACFETQFYQTGVMTCAVMMRRSDMPPQGYPEDMPSGEDYCVFLQMLGAREAYYWSHTTTRVRRRGGQATEDSGVRLQVYNGLARLRALDYLKGTLPAEIDTRLRKWALDELAICAYSRYWKGDYVIANRAFGWLQQFGARVPWRHRVKAKLGVRFGRPGEGARGH